MATPADPLGSDDALIRMAGDSLARRLPPRWSIDATVDSILPWRADGFFIITAPDGRSVKLVVEVKRVVETRSISAVAQQLSELAEGTAALGMIVTRYLSPQVRKQLTERGLAFADATGNIRLEVSSPGIFIADHGADADPWRGPGRPLGTLKGEPAARLVRTIVDFASDWSIRELVNRAGVSTGAAYRVLDLLEGEGLADRSKRGRVSVPRWDQILRMWSQDYGFVRSNHLTRYIAPRGIDHLIGSLAAGAVTDYAVSGTVAAAEWASYAPARSLMAYARDAAAAAAAWGLRPADAGANVMLAEPDYDVPLIRTLENEAGVRVAAPSQVVVDLMTGPGRSPQEAEELLLWMVNNEQSWRG